MPKEDVDILDIAEEISDSLSLAAAQGKNPGGLVITGCRYGKNKLTLGGF